jgi:hypothetical protein
VAMRQVPPIMNDNSPWHAPSSRGCVDDLPSPRSIEKAHPPDDLAHLDSPTLRPKTAACEAWETATKAAVWRTVKVSPIGKNT